MIKELGKGKARLIVSVGSAERGDRTRYTKTVTYSSKKELKKLYEEFEAEARSRPACTLTIEQLVENYINKRIALGIKQTTVVGYRHDLKRIVGLLGRISADSLTTYHLENKIAQAASKGRTEGKGFSPKTIANTIGLLSAAYDDAVRTGQLSVNPCKNVLLPKRNRKEIYVFNNDEVMKFLDALLYERMDYKVGYELALLCGLRRSEILGLRESDVDLQEGTVSVWHTRHRVGGQTVEQNTKTARSRRTLALPSVLIEDIRALISIHHLQDFPTSDYLIQDGFGQPINPQVLSQHIFIIERDADLPHVSLHGLRHTFASMLNAEKIDVARISAELGHSNITTTLNIYTHVFGDASESSKGIANTIDEKLGNSATILPHDDEEKTSEC